MEYKFYLGLITVLIGVVSYGWYFKDIFKGKTKPHALSWLVWGVLNSVIFIAQSNDNAGAGRWITGCTAAVSLLIFVVSLKYGEKRITVLDRYCLAGAAATILLWYTLHHNSLATVLASMTFALGFIPTFRKAYYKPHQETTLTFALNGSKFFIALFALNQLTLMSMLYPATVAGLNFGFVILLIVRVSQLKSTIRKKRR